MANERKTLSSHFGNVNKASEIANGPRTIPTETTKKIWQRQTPNDASSKAQGAMRRASPHGNRAKGGTIELNFGCMSAML